jgi:hypothetical protein
MCFGGGQKAPAPIQPAAPPPPPPVLEQVAPTVSAPTATESAKNKAMGTKQYRSPLSIGSATSSATNTGVGVAT